MVAGGWAIVMMLLESSYHRGTIRAPFVLLCGTYLWRVTHNGSWLWYYHDAFGVRMVQ